MTMLKQLPICCNIRTTSYSWENFSFDNCGIAPFNGHVTNCLKLPIKLRSYAKTLLSNPLLDWQKGQETKVVVHYRVSHHQQGEGERWAHQQAHARAVSPATHDFHHLHYWACSESLSAEMLQICFLGNVMETPWRRSLAPLPRQRAEPPEGSWMGPSLGRHPALRSRSHPRPCHRWCRQCPLA